MRIYVAIVATLACILAGAALTVSLTHAGPRGTTGPRGPQGEQGTTGRNAEVAHLGFCFQSSTNSATGDVNAVFVMPPVLTDGVPSCPGGQFVSIVPQSTIAGAQGNGAGA